jgi:integrase
VNSPTMRIRFKHVTVRRNRNGTIRYYFQRRGQPLVALPSDPQSVEFAEAYRRCMEWKGSYEKEGSFGWLCDQYMDSPEFKSKATATRNARRRIILAMMNERLDPKFPETFGMERLSTISRRHIEILRDRKARNPNAGNERLKVLSQIFKLAVARNWREDNPVKDAARLSIPRGGHRTATDVDIEAYESFHRDGMAHRCMVLLKAFGVRVSDLRIIGPQHVRNGLLVFETVKTGVLCNLTIGEDARREMEACRSLVFLTNEHGAAFASDKALSQRVAKWFRQAGVKGVTAHGVRKWLATKMAENGASEYELMAWFGWRDPKEARPYVEAANRLRLAAAAGARMRKVNDR